ncbi:MAG: hypothetical protein Q8S39_07535, partial [Ignavibacteria bacterium]|nr:hypothetical protein [Ignavibacteria bacterium]
MENEDKKISSWAIQTMSYMLREQSFSKQQLEKLVEICMVKTNSDIATIYIANSGKNTLEPYIILYKNP